MKNKQRLDKLLTELGLVETRNKAQALIMAGKVRVDGQVVSKAGTLYESNANITLDEVSRWAGRGAQKLLGAFEAFDLKINGKVCADFGASTGGFTDVMLEKGAKKVYAIDVGYGQLITRLANDSRVIVMDRTNARYLTREDFPEAIEFAACDVSFISLTLIIPPCLQWLRPDGKLICLIKPQFELGPKETVKGVVRSEAAQKRAVEKIVSFATNYHLHLRSLLPSQIKGPKGNQEYLALFEFL